MNGSLLQDKRNSRDTKFVDENEPRLERKCIALSKVVAADFLTMGCVMKGYERESSLYS